MKKFEIEVVRTYTTYIEVEVLDHLMAADVERIAMYNNVLEEEEDLYEEIWEAMAEKELEQMNSELETVNVKEL